MTKSLDGRRVVVVGGSAGIGRALAVRAARQGARVMVAARRGGQIDELRREAGPEASLFGVAIDVCVPADGARLAPAALAGLGGIDLLVYSAGYSPLCRLATVISSNGNEFCSPTWSGRTRSSGRPNKVIPIRPQGHTPR